MDNVINTGMLFIYIDLRTISNKLWKGFVRDMVSGIVVLFEQTMQTKQADVLDNLVFEKK